MAFRELIERMHEADPAIRGGALAGGDGLVVEEWAREGADCDLPALCAETAQLFRDIRRVASEQGMGETGELTLCCEKGNVFLRGVGTEYFLLVVTDKGAIPGKWSFLLKQAGRRAVEML